MLISAALLGSGLGLSLGAAYLAGGMARHAADHARVGRLAEAAEGGFSGQLLQDPSVLRLTPGEAPSPQRQLAEFTQKLDRKSAKRPTASRELDCLTQAVYYEARGESPRGQFAVAQVVMNRVKHPAFPKTVCGVVYQGAGARGCQFSFACDGSTRGRRELSAWNKARRIAARALAGAAIPDVGAATHFHTTAVAPTWGPQMKRVAQVGMHVFYRFNPRRAVSAAVQPVVLTAEPIAAQPELRLMNAVLEPAPVAQTPAAPAEPHPPSNAEAKPAAPPSADAAALKPSQTGDAAVS